MTWWALRVLINRTLRLWARLSVLVTVRLATLRNITWCIGIPGPRILSRR